MYPNYIKNLLQIEDVIAKKGSHGLFNTTFIMLETKPNAHTCPKCSNLTSRIHDYRLQRIKHIPFGINSSILILKKRRYACSCGKHFYENYSWLPMYQYLLQLEPSIELIILSLLNYPKYFVQTSLEETISFMRIFP